MTKQRRSFSAEFKREAAGLMLDQDYSHTEASRSLGIAESALRRWVNQLQQKRNGVTPQSKVLTPEQLTRCQKNLCVAYSSIIAKARVARLRSKRKEQA